MILKMKRWVTVCQTSRKRGNDMTKINQEEYEILKELDDKWKWIAKDDNYGGFIFCFREKPHKDIRKGGWSPDTTQYKCLWEYDSLFKFIQWENEEPHNIAELIEGYEHKEFYDYVGWQYYKSGETEVKNIEWLKKGIHKELENWHGVEGGIDGDGINEIMLLINQHEESEVKRLDRKMKELESFNDELIRDNNQLRNELDSQEVLSSDWIAGKKMWTRNKIPFHMGVDYAVPVNDLQNLLVPKQELPVIPKFVAEAIEEDKEAGCDVYDSIYFIIETNGGGIPSISDWVAVNKDKYARAWLDGYTVEEEEKKYIVSDNSSIPLLIKDDSGKVMSYDSQIAYNNSNGTIELTEQEIKDYDKRYMAFAKPAVVCN